MNEKYRILLVEDDDDYRRSLESFLTLVGFSVTGAASSLACYRLIAEHSFDVVVVDLGLPDQKGETLIDYLRNNVTSGIIVLTGRDKPATRIACYELGADVFFSKPVDTRELAAAVGSAAARSRRMRKTRQMLGTLTTAGQWILEQDRRLLRSPEMRQATLSRRECELILALAETSGRTVARAELLRRLYARQDESANRALEALVRRVRNRIEPISDGSPPLVTDHGAGYAFSSKISIR